MSPAGPGLPDAAQRVASVLREHRIECTGVEGVTCRACRDLDWMSWGRYAEHVAEFATRAAREDVPDLTRRLAEAEAKVARVEAALRLIGDEHITPVGARQIRAALADPMPDAATVGGGIPGSWTLDDEAGR